MDHQRPFKASEWAAMPPRAASVKTLPFGQDLSNFLIIQKFCKLIPKVVDDNDGRRWWSSCRRETTRSHPTEVGRGGGNTFDRHVDLFPDTTLSVNILVMEVEYLEKRL